MQRFVRAWFKPSVENEKRIKDETKATVRCIPFDQPGAKGATPLTIALDHSNIHHYLVGAQGALPVDLGVIKRLKIAGREVTGEAAQRVGNAMERNNEHPESNDCAWSCRRSPSTQWVNSCKC